MNPKSFNFKGLAGPIAPNRKAFTDINNFDEQSWRGSSSQQLIAKNREKPAKQGLLKILQTLITETENRYLTQKDHLVVRILKNEEGVSDQENDPKLHQLRNGAKYSSVNDSYKETLGVTERESHIDQIEGIDFYGDGASESGEQLFKKIEELSILLKYLGKNKRRYEEELTEKSLDERSVYEVHMQKLEAQIRDHIRVEQQLKLYAESLQQKIEELETQNEPRLSQDEQHIQNGDDFHNQSTEYEQELETHKFEVLKQENIDLRKKITSLEKQLSNVTSSHQKSQASLSKLESEMVRYKKEGLYKQQLIQSQSQQYSQQQSQTIFKKSGVIGVGETLRPSKSSQKSNLFASQLYTSSKQSHHKKNTKKRFQGAGHKTTIGLFPKHSTCRSIGNETMIYKGQTGSASRKKCKDGFSNSKDPDQSTISIAQKGEKEKRAILKNILKMAGKNNGSGIAAVSGRSKNQTLLYQNRDKLSTSKHTKNKSRDRSAILNEGSQKRANKSRNSGKAQPSLTKKIKNQQFRSYDSRGFFQKKPQADHGRNNSVFSNRSNSTESTRKANRRKGVLNSNAVEEYGSRPKKDRSSSRRSSGKKLFARSRDQDSSRMLKISEKLKSLKQNLKFQQPKTLKQNYKNEPMEGESGQQDYRQDNNPQQEGQQLQNGYQGDQENDYPQDGQPLGQQEDQQPQNDQNGLEGQQDQYYEQEGENQGEGQEEYDQEAIEGEEEEQFATVEDQIRERRREVKRLKEENNKLRNELKDLNGRLTSTIEKLRVRTYKRKNVSKTSEKTLEKVLSNSHKQVELYEKQLHFLEERAEEGDQFDRIQSLQEEVNDMKKEEETLKKQLSLQKKDLKKSEKMLQKSLNEQSHKETINYMINEQKFLKLKVRKMNEKEEKLEKAYTFNRNCLEKLMQRQSQLSEQLGKRGNLQFNFYEDGRVGVKKVGEKQPGAPAKKKVVNVSEYWKNDHPSKFEVILNKKHFEGLKEKVLLLKRGERVARKQHQYKSHQCDSNHKKLVAEEQHLNKQLKEKEKEYQLLLKQLETEKRGIKHGALLPIEKIINFKKLENEEGNLILKVGKCDSEIRKGEQGLYGDNKRVKVRSLKIWTDRKRIVGMQNEYSPYFDTPVYGKSGPRRNQIIGFYKLDIKKMTVVHSEKEILSITIMTGTHDTLVIGDPEKEGQASSVNFPPYQMIRTIFFYGDNIRLTGLGFHLIH